jgi:hypothetical protein
MSAFGTDFRAIRDAIWASSLPPVPRLVALRLVEHLPRAMPSVASLVEHTGYRRDAVMAALRHLEQNGCIVVERHHGHRSEYRFTGHWPERSDRSAKATGRREPPVGESHRTRRQDRPLPVAETDTKQTREAGKEAEEAGSALEAAPLPAGSRVMPSDYRPSESLLADAAMAGVTRDTLEQAVSYWRSRDLGALVVDVDQFLRSKLPGLRRRQELQSFVDERVRNSGRSAGAERKPPPAGVPVAVAMRNFQ